MKISNLLICRHFFSALVAVWLTLAGSAWAGNACVRPDGGMGGTGVRESGIGGTGAVAKGVGGTGAPQQGIGGTGAVASGVGGTGAPQQGMGGTGAVASGVGGTGAVASGIGGTGAPESGIGGTGAVAGGGIGGTGIIGTITGFASVCLGELEVHYDAGTPVSANGEASSLNRLALGQVVAIEAGPGAKGLTARNIAIVHALEGPVTRSNAAAGVVEVMGQPVRLAAGVDAAALQPGTNVRVSGLRDARGHVVATRIEAAPDLREASAVGFVRGNGASVDGLPVAGARATGGEVLVRGSWDGKRLNARETRNDPSTPFAGRVREVVVEGLVTRRDGRSVAISGFELTLERNTRVSGGNAGDLKEGSRVRVQGRLDGARHIDASRIEIERERGPRDGRARHGGERGSSSGSGDDRSGRDGDDRSGRDGGTEDRGSRGGTDDRGGGVERGGGERGGGAERGGAERGGGVERGGSRESVERSAGAERGGSRGGRGD